MPNKPDNPRREEEKNPGERKYRQDEKKQKPSNPESEENKNRE